MQSLRYLLKEYIINNVNQYLIPIIMANFGLICTLSLFFFIIHFMYRMIGRRWLFVSLGIFLILVIIVCFISTLPRILLQLSLSIVSDKRGDLFVALSYYIMPNYDCIEQVSIVYPIETFIILFTGLVILMVFFSFAVNNLRNYLRYRKKSS